MNRSHVLAWSLLVLTLAPVPASAQAQAPAQPQETKPFQPSVGTVAQAIYAHETWEQGRAGFCIGKRGCVPAPDVSRCQDDLYVGGPGRRRGSRSARQTLRFSGFQVFDLLRYVGHLTT